MRGQDGHRERGKHCLQKYYQDLHPTYLPKISIRWSLSSRRGNYFHSSFVFYVDHEPQVSEKIGKGGHKVCVFKLEVSPIFMW